MSVLYNSKIWLRYKLGRDSFIFRTLEKSVDWIKALVPFEWRYNPEFSQFKKLLEESQYWSKEKLDEYQFIHSKKLLEYAEKNIPWYQKKFAEYGVSSKDFVNLQDIKKFPLVTKEEIRDNLDQFISKEFSKRELMYVTTGGSTAIPFGFYQPSSLEKIDLAFFDHHWGWVGCKLTDTSVVLRGEFVGNENKLFDYKPSKREWRFSTYYLNEKTFDQYFKKLNEIKPVFIQAYPSAAELFAQFMREKNLKLSFKLKAVMLGSENIYDEQIDLIEKTFDAKVHTWYGQAERVSLAPWSKNSRLFHIFPQYGLTELLDSSGNEVTNEDETGEIVATGFYNFAMPFIRYRTMDLATHTNQKSPDGFNYRLFKRIEGRLQELIVTSSGRLISMTAINMHDETFDNVRQFQFYQDTPGKVTLKILPNEKFSERDLNRIYDSIKFKLGDDTELEIKIVDSIPRTKSGKLRFLDQKLQIKNWSRIDKIR
jgi:phenylacetate-CoA ligase